MHEDSVLRDAVRHARTFPSPPSHRLRVQHALRPDPATAQSVPAVAGLIGVAIGGLVLVGWTFDIDALKRLVPGFVTMKANTAVCFVLLGFALWASRDAGRRSLRGTAAAVIVVVISLLTLMQYVAGTDLGIDRLLFTETVEEAGLGVPGRMAVTTTVAFPVIAWLVAGPRRILERTRPLTGLALAGILVATLISLVPYLYGAVSIVPALGLTTMAFHTALGLLALAFGVLVLRLPSGPVRLLLGRRMSASFTRRMLVAAIAIPLITGWVVLIGQDLRVLTPEAGEAFLVIATMLFMGSAVWQAGQALELAEREHTRAEQGARMLATIVSDADDAILSKAVDGTITSWNGGAERMYGWAAAEAIGRHVSLIVPPGQRAEVDDMIRSVALGERIEHRETVRVHRDGHHLDVSLTLSPMRDEAGRVSGISVIARDVSAQRRAQRQLEGAKAELERSNRELQDFASVASHDLQEPLRKVRAFSDRLSRHLGADASPHVQADLARIADAASRMQRLIDDLLAYARVTTRARPSEPVDLDELVRDALADLDQRVAETHATVVIDALPPVHGDRTQLRQVFVNLLGNALKYRHADHPPTVRIAGEEALGRVTLEVRDDGIGFDQAHAERIFAPFERLHGRDEYEGTGIGLAIVRKIVERHGGRIEAHGEPGRGATFRLVLPAARAQGTVA